MSSTAARPHSPWAGPLQLKEGLCLVGAEGRQVRRLPGGMAWHGHRHGATTHPCQEEQARALHGAVLLLQSICRAEDMEPDHCHKLTPGVPVRSVWGHWRGAPGDGVGLKGEALCAHGLGGREAWWCGLGKGAAR